MWRDLPNSTESVVVVLDRVNHALARKVRTEAMNRGLSAFWEARRAGPGDRSTSAGYEAMAREPVTERTVADHSRNRREVSSYISESSRPVVLARRLRTIRMSSAHARSEGRCGYSPLSERWQMADHWIERAPSERSLFITLASITSLLALHPAQAGAETRELLLNLVFARGTRTW